MRLFMLALRLDRFVDAFETMLGDGKEENTTQKEFKEEEATRNDQPVRSHSQSCNSEFSLLPKPPDHQTTYFAKGDLQSSFHPELGRFPVSSVCKQFDSKSRVDEDPSYEWRGRPSSPQTPEVNQEMAEFEMLDDQGTTNKLAPLDSPIMQRLPVCRFNK